ncbi:MAG: O-linked GlcNAc transferase-like protein [Lachnospiraceae bacterium]|nr:O-linked GlcNAc transferase-like protein [Lachnospiraceae bacterium]
MKIQKGQYGYRESRKKIQLTLVLLLIAAILGQLAARQCADQEAARNILTVMAILTVLPMANLASPLLASWKYRTPAEDFHKKVQAYEGQYTVLYDLIVTTKEFVIPIDAAAVHPQGVYAYCPASGLDTGKAEKALNALFSANHLDPNLKLIRDEHSFLRRLDSLRPADAFEDDGTVAYAAKLMKNISM